MSETSETDDHENPTLDEEIVDKERADALPGLADQELFDLDLERRMEIDEAERQRERERADRERENPDADA